MSASINLDRLDFSPGAISDGPLVGSYILGAAGTVITESGTALDINIASSDIDLNVDIQLDDLVADDAVDTEAPLKVGSRSVDQASALSAISAAGDKANAISDLYRRIYMTSAPSVGWSYAQATTSAIANTAAQADGTKQVGRQYVVFKNLSTSTTIHIGSDASVTTANGIPVEKKESVSLDLGEALDLYTVSSGTSIPFALAQVG